mmetsp:Transcript_58045/g.123284  ORF Transcript_58045/g.123284 Transcript_58045/m.123284 type:complete len:144 (-) Transcript_58045:116-547(-)
MSQMSMGQRMQPGRPPDKGSFPLDHFNECTDLKAEYLRCLKENQHDNMSCRYLSKRYLECRMDKNLMREESMDRLGFTDQDNEKKPPRDKGKGMSKEDRGWVVGVDNIQPDRHSAWRRPTLLNLMRLMVGGEDHSRPVPGSKG